MTGPARYVECATAEGQLVEIQCPCTVFLLAGYIKLRGQRRGTIQRGFAVENETVIELGGVSAAVIIQGDQVGLRPSLE